MGDARRLERWLVALLVVVAVASFARTLLYGYILDDTSIIRGNPIVQSWAGVVAALTHPFWKEDGPSRSGLYRPLIIAIFTVIWNAGHKFAVWFHLFAVGLHAGATWLVWRLLRRGVGRWPALAAALWFAVHPVHVEAVASIANSSEVLVFTWTALLALLLGRANERAARESAIPWPAAAGIAVLYAAAVLTKESGFVAPALGGLWAWGWHERRAVSSGVTATMFRNALHRWWRPLAACGAVFLAVLVARMVVLGGAVSGGSIAAPGLEGLSAWERCRAMLSLGPRGVALLFWPVAPLSPHYGPELLVAHAPSMGSVLTLALLIAVLAIAIRIARSGDPRPLTGVAWILVAMLPASNLLVATGQILAERTMYGASAGAAMLLAWGVHAAAARAAGHGAASKRSADLLLSALVACSVVRAEAITVNYAGVWESHDRLFSYLVMIEPNGYRGHWLHALAERNAGRLDASLEDFAHAFALYPRDRQLTIDYSNTLLVAGRAKEAAAVAAHLMEFADLRTNANAVGLYLDAVAKAYGPDSARARMRLLAPAVGRGTRP